jgi:hypothetical protein
MAAFLRIEHLFLRGILHTAFEKPSRIGACEDIRQVGDRMMHAVLKWTETPAWVTLLDNLTIQSQR